MEYTKLQKLIDQYVSSAGTRRHAHILYGLVRWLQPESVIEIGSWMGYTGCFLAQALRDNGHGRLFCVDNYSLHGGSAASLHNVLSDFELADITTIIDGNSREVPWPVADMVFIDGDHSLDGCRADYLQAVASGAYCIVIHDTVAWWGTREFIDGYSGGYSKLEVGFDEGLAILMKRIEKPPVTYTQDRFPSGSV